MERKYLKDLIEWNNSKYRKPLIVYGARQVGKTFLIKNLFAERYYKNKYIYIDCINNTKFSEFCFNHQNIDEIINYLSLEYNLLIDKNTLLIFDEVQECLPIITLLKYFHQEKREIPIIVTGSMVRIKLKRVNNKRGPGNNSYLFPVGQINELNMYALDFSEYLMNRNKNVYNSLINTYNNKQVVSSALHIKALELFYEYLAIGGMPEVVNVFLETNNLLLAIKALKELYNNYLSDMELYQASPEAIIRARKVFLNIFSELNKENKNFKINNIEKGKRNRDFTSAIDWLEMAYLVNKSYLIKENITIPLRPSNESIFRLYLTDIGIFTYQSGINYTLFLDSNTKNSLAGIFYENYIASELIKNNIPLYYWSGKNNGEFEFIINDKNKIIPIDIKKNKGSLTSLNKYKQHNKLDYIIKVSANNYGYDKENKILTIPFYEFFCYLEELNKFSI